MRYVGQHRTTCGLYPSGCSLCWLLPACRHSCNIYVCSHKATCMTARLVCCCGCRLNDLPDAVRRAELPAITITSYEMMKRLTCPACQKLQGAAAAAAARAAKARQAEAAACNSTAAAAASEAATVDGSNPGGTAAAAQACGARGSGGGARGRGRGRGRGQVAAAPVQDSVVTWSKEVVWDVSETGGCSGAGDRPGGRAGKRCHGCTGPGECITHRCWTYVSSLLCCSALCAGSCSNCPSQVLAAGVCFLDGVPVSPSCPVRDAHSPWGVLACWTLQITAWRLCPGVLSSSTSPTTSGRPTPGRQTHHKQVSTHKLSCTVSPHPSLS